MYKRTRAGWIKHWDFTIADLLMSQLAFIIAYMIRHGFVFPYASGPYRRLAIIMVLLDIVVVFISEAYSGVLRRTKWQELRSTVIIQSVIFFGMIASIALIKMMDVFSRQVLFTYWPLAIVLCYGARVVIKRIVRKSIIYSKNRAIMILVTPEALAQDLIKEFNGNIYRDYDVQGVVIIDKDMRGQEISGVPVVATADDFYEYIKLNVVDEVFIQGGSQESTEIFSQELLEMGLTVHYSILHNDSIAADHIIGHMGHYTVLTQSLKIASSSKLAIKRLGDIVGSIVGLIFTGIVFIIFAPIIKFSSKGPIFFSQIRVGQNGRQFKLYKFRSMYVDAEERKAELMEQNEMGDSHTFKMKNDPRITGVGRFMRKFSLDEFPQFLNVLKGDMSLVGTRPPTVDEVEGYDLHHKARLSMRPGITGLWQVSGRNKITDFEEIVKLDKKYITEWSLGLDIVILFKTVGVVITARGSQ